mgnify:CR=1 FL=1
MSIRRASAGNREVVGPLAVHAAVRPVERADLGGAAIGAGDAAAGERDLVGGRQLEGDLPAGAQGVAHLGRDDEQADADAAA